MQLSSMAEIDTYVSQKGQPEVVSIAEDTHVFHFEQDGRWRDAHVLLVNRNGHHFRLLRQDDDRWLFCKTWNDIFDYADWMVEAQLIRRDPEELIGLCGIGPQGRQSFESLSLLPRGTTFRRKAVWRNHILNVRFDLDNNRFYLTLPNADRDTPAPPPFSGKLWESQDAAKWCLANLSGPVLVTPSHVRSAIDEQVQQELESSDLWGMF